MDNRKMLHFNRIDISQGIYVNQTKHQKSVIFVTIGIF